MPLLDPQTGLSLLAERVDRHGERISRLEERSINDSKKIDEIKADIQGIRKSLQTIAEDHSISLQKRWERVLDWGFKIFLILYFGKSLIN